MNCLKCPSYNSCNKWKEFVLAHSKLKSYAHFDQQVSLAMPSILTYVMNTRKIASHSFYPFVHFTKTISRFGKKTPKKRELYYCAHLDRCVYQRYAFLLNQQYNILVQNKGINDVAVAYRDNLGKNNIDFAKDAFENIKLRNKCMIIVGDFTNFFDTLDHQYLKDRWCDLLNGQQLPNDHYAVFKNITRFASWDWKLLVKQIGHNITECGIRKKINKQKLLLSKEEFDKYKKCIEKNKKSFGIPQGSPISAVLSNIYMILFDEQINNYISQNNGKYMRYSDDFIIILPYTSEKDIDVHYNFVQGCVNNVKNLDLQQEKTSIYIFDNETILKYPTKEFTKIDYLGFLFDGKKIKIRPKSITKYYYRMHRKAHNIGKNNWHTFDGKFLSAKKLYEIYSTGGSKQTFIDYAKKATRILKLDDPESKALIKNHKRKISKAIKSKKD